MKPQIMIISSVHRWDDTRIFHRQASSLAKKYSVELHAPADFDQKSINGIKVIGLPRWKKEKDRIRLWWILLKRIIKSKASIVHFHDSELIPLAFVVKVISRKKIIYDVHEQIIFDIEDKEWIPGFLKPIVLFVFVSVEKICIPTFDAVIYTTPKVGERYLKMSKNAISIENYSRLDTFSQIHINNTSKSEHIVLYLGRVLNVRGVDRVIRAFEHVIKDIPSAKFLIVGDIVPESYEEELNALTKELKLENNVDFLGFVPHLETIHYLKSAYCGIVTFLPAKINKACLPNKLFEYMASGLPVIASDFELYKEVVDGSQCGITVDPDNIETISNAILFLFNNPDIANKMGASGKNAFETRYNWEVEEGKLLDLYNKILKT